MAKFVHPLGAGDWHMGGGIAEHHARGSAEHDYQHLNGVDMMMNHPGEQLPVYAVADGVLTVRDTRHETNKEWVYSHNAGTMGYKAHLRGAEDTYFYRHMERMAPGLHPGDRVVSGQLIGWTGAAATGGAHLHFACHHGNTEQFLQDASIDPADYGHVPGHDNTTSPAHPDKDGPVSRPDARDGDASRPYSMPDDRGAHSRQDHGRPDGHNLSSHPNDGHAVSGAGHPNDGGVVADPGHPHDGGVVSDPSHPQDGGAVSGAGHPSDGGVVADPGHPHDGGVVSDP
ncbi:MAG: peptidoglycan DD-metalloendopeptidase family protein, partial [Terracidiphilus sp.]